MSMMRDSENLDLKKQKLVSLATHGGAEGEFGFPAVEEDGAGEEGIGGEAAR